MDNRKDLFGEYSLPAGKTTGVFPKVIRVSYEGYFECVASVQNNTEINATVSQTHYLRVIGESKYSNENIDVSLRECISPAAFNARVLD